MYGQGSCNSQFGRGPPTPMPPPYQQQQQLPGPPPLPPHFQHGRPVPPSSVFQPGPPIYQQSPSVPPPAGRQIQPDVAPSTSQLYLHSQPTVHGSTPLPRMHSTDQQNKQLPTYLGTQNVQHLSMSMHPHPPRVFPPPPRPATMYRTPMHQQSQQPGGAQDLQHMPLPPSSPHPPTSSSFTSNPFGSFVQSTGKNSHMPSVASMPAPPPPSDPPPIPPSPPPSTSPSTHQQAASILISFNKPYDSEVSTSGYIEKSVTASEVRHNVPQDGGALNQKGSPVADSLLLRGSVMLNLPSTPPPKPTEEKVFQKIQDLCELIAKSGPGYEDLVRQNECGNPEFEFLFPGDPGSEATVAHDYFLWMKSKCIFSCKFNEGKGDSPLRPSETVSSIQPNHLEFASGTYSPYDSDMEMEDDITQYGNDPGVDHSAEGINSAYNLPHSELDVKEELHKKQMSESESVAFAAPVLVKQGQEAVSNHEQLAFERPVSTVCSQLINSADQQSLTSNLKKSATSSVDEKIPSGASVAAPGLNSKRKSSQITKGGSPFRFLQDYASDDISENDDEDPEFVSPLKDSSSAAVGAASPHINARLNPSLKAVNFLEGSGRQVKEIATASISSGKTDDHVSDKHENQASISHAESPQGFQQKPALAVANVEVRLNSKFQKEYKEEDAKSASNSLKVDEFGRLVREGASESESDDSRYNGRQCKRGRSRSRSPVDRWSRRSPRRRRDKRSRSRSWSPRNRRSWSRSPRRRRISRSPPSRHAGEVGGDGMRRGKGQIPECFDFRRGRCYRGASCRYLHHDSDKGDGMKCHRSKLQYLETALIPKNSNIHGEFKHNLLKVSDQQHCEVNISEMQLGQDMAVSSFVVGKDAHVCQKRGDSINSAAQSGSFDQHSQLIASHSTRSASSSEAAAERLQTHVLPQEERKVLTTVTNKRCQEATESKYSINDDDRLKSNIDASLDTLPLEDSLIKPSKSKLSDPLLQNADCPVQQTDNSSISDSFPERTSVTPVNKLPVTEPLLNTIEFRHHSAQLLPPPPALLEGATAQHMIQPLGDYNLIPQNASFSSQSSSTERFPSYMLPNQQSRFSSPIASWTPLPPPPPSVSSQLQQSHLPTGNDIGSQIRQYTSELPTTQAGDFPHQAYPPVQEPNRSNMRAEDFRLKGLPPSNLSSEQLSGPSLLKEDNLTHLPMLELSANKMQSFPGDNLPPGEPLKSPSQAHPCLQQPQPVYGLHHPSSVGSSSRYPSDRQEANQASHPPDFSESRNSTYYNPYSSTFEHPPSSKFSSVFRQEDTTYNTKYASPFRMPQVQDEGRDIGSVGSRQATSSPNSAKAVGQGFPRSGGDQYDPLLDSIEPSSSLPKKINNVQKWEPSSDSDIMLRLSGSYKPLNVEENKKKEIGDLALAGSVDNEEYGETADAEVGAVENGSPSNHIDAANMNAGEIEIDQIKSPGKSKKNKESRSMKLFKVALADFVKEVLKPSWRQGNMSKEAFKTIVKKTVDKVSGAMKSHHIPKSRAKIDQYIVSSQRKLTKLVTGYVDKYVKM